MPNALIIGRPEDYEVIFAHILAEIAPKRFGFGECVGVIVQNPLTFPDGTSNTSEIFVGSASNMIWFMIPGERSEFFIAEDLKDLYIKLNFPSFNPNGVVLTDQVAIGGAGANYTVGDVLTITAPGDTTPATTTVLTLDGHITAAVLNAGGAGYVAGNTLAVTGGNGLARIVVDTVDGGGAVLTFHVSVQGAGYTSTVGNATTGGAGAGATFNTTASRGVATVSSPPTTGGTGFEGGTDYAATGGTGAGAVIRVLTVETSIPESADINLLIYRKRKGGLQ